ncbi:MAG: YciI family protein [Acidisphaera sp.]|nr:YciI family protein [Acidisphaera sp.]
MQYLLLIYEDESVYGADKQGEAMNRVVAGHMALSQSLGGKRLAGAGLRNTASATTLRTGADGGKTLHDGPFAETKEQLGGFYMIEADDLDDAIAIARKIPLYRDGAIEIRPLLGQGERKATAAA